MKFRQNFGDLEFAILDKKELVLEYIEKNIAEGKYKVGSKVMSEIDMSEKFGVSRVIVREALAILSKKGVVEKKVGSGTYIKDISSYKKKTYIIITTPESTLINQSSFHFKQSIDKMKELIQEAGYTPYVFLENEYLKISETENNSVQEDLTKYINIPLDDIAGIISLKSHKTKYSTFRQNKIPIVTLYNSVSVAYPSVNSDYSTFYRYIFQLIEKYNLKDVIFFKYVFNNFSFNTEYLFHYGMAQIIKDRFHLYEIPFSNDNMETSKHFEDIVKGLDRIPDAMVIMDNNIYLSGLHLFSKYDNLFKNTKIIVHSNNYEIFPKDYDICRITFCTEDFAVETVSLLLNIINNDFSNQVLKNIKPKIINEEALAEK